MMSARAMRFLPDEEAVNSEKSSRKAEIEVSDSPKRLNRQACSEISRVAQSIFFSKPDEHSKIILLCGTDPGQHRSEWIAIHVGHFLAMRGRSARVLCIGDQRAERHATEAMQEKPGVAPSGQCIFEWISGGSQDVDLTREVVTRLKRARQAGEDMLVHVEDLNRFPEILSCAEHLDGAALLVRSSQTRKAALSAAREQLVAADLPLLGGILIDQTYPVPERFYRAL